MRKIQLIFFGRTFFGGQREERRVVIFRRSSSLSYFVRGNCKMRLMRPLAIGVDIASPLVVGSATLYYDERAALCFIQKELPARTIARQ